MARQFYCIRNAGTADARSLEALGVRPHDCLERCRHCFETPFVILEHDDKRREVIDAPTHAELLERVRPAAKNSPRHDG